MTVLLFYTVGASLVVIAIVAGVVISTKARRLDALHKNILRSRAALENALNTRARVAQEVAHSGVLDLAGSVVLDSAAGRQAMRLAIFLSMMGLIRSICMV